jgi:YVTN family beta-propeller protein
MRILALAGAVGISLAAAGGSGPPNVLAKITTGSAPCGVVAAYRSVWVANDGGTLVRINPRTNRVTKRIRTGRGSCQLAAGAGALWIANYKQGLVRVLPTGAVRKVAVGAVPDHVLVAFNRVWVTAWGDGKVAVVDPRTLRVVRRIAVGAKPLDLIAKNGAVWVGFGQGSSIARIDPATGSVKRFDVGESAPRIFVTGARDLWVQADGRHLVRVDPETGRDLAHMHFGKTLAEAATAPDGSIWMPDKEENVVYRIDPRRSAVIDSFGAGRGAFVAFRAYGSMWVTSFAGTDVWRYEP